MNMIRRFVRYFLRPLWVWAHQPGLYWVIWYDAAASRRPWNEREYHRNVAQQIRVVRRVLDHQFRAQRPPEYAPKPRRRRHEAKPRVTIAVPKVDQPTPTQS